MNWLKHFLDLAPISANELAKRAGTSRQQISKLVHEQRGLSKQWAERLAPHLGVQPSDLMFGPDADVPTPSAIPPVQPSAKDEPPPLPPPDASHPVPLRISHKTIPVYGHAAGGMNEDGKFILNGSKIADVLCPPALETVAGAYAVYHTGESMLPRYEPGDLLTIHPSLPVKRGDYVLVQITGDDGDPPYGYVKRFVSRNAKELVLEQLNPPEDEDSILRFPADRVLTVHVIWGASRG